jgi:hypothetical protein
MRLKTFGIGAVAVLAAGSAGLSTGIHHVLAANNCAAGTAPTGPYTGTSQIGSNAPIVVGVGSPDGCIEAGANPSGNGVIYNPVGGSANAAPGVYVIAQGSQNAPVSQGQGYAGISDYENNGTADAQPETNDAPCEPGGPDGTSSGSNGGGTVAVGEGGCTGGLEQSDGQIVVGGIPTGVYLLAPVACGHVSGNDWSNTDRDGCEEP